MLLCKESKCVVGVVRVVGVEDVTENDSPRSALTSRGPESELWKGDMGKAMMSVVRSNDSEDGSSTSSGSEMVCVHLREFSREPIGIHLSLMTELPEVVEVAPNSAAARFGVEIGDRVVSVNEVICCGCTPAAAGMLYKLFQLRPLVLKLQRSARKDIDEGLAEALRDFRSTRPVSWGIDTKASKMAASEQSLSMLVSPVAKRKGSPLPRNSGKLAVVELASPRGNSDFPED
mmetsp:Transcript_46073/g.104407  ORF Transcript_46073/g.104407 Transcript_46073/m.104407 type:complete len:232 (+) Transcript_46073:25-720(+)